MASFSVSAELDGRGILITGGLGFLGSVCLEQVLRLTEVSSDCQTQAAAGTGAPVPATFLIPHALLCIDKHTEACCIGLCAVDSQLHCTRARCNACDRGLPKWCSAVRQPIVIIQYVCACKGCVPGACFPCTEPTCWYCPPHPLP
jgi:hypothetical protein